MTGSVSRAGLLGRQNECQALGDLLAGIRAGRSAALVLRGESGIGKTELLKYLLERSTRCRIVRAAGVQSEMELSYAGLHQLCTPLLAGLENLPGPQRDALSTALGLRDGDPPSRFLVGLAALSLLADVGGNQPLVCLIDDAQWLDHVSAQTLEFVARRLLAESILLVFAVREPSPGETLAGLPELHVTGLTDTDSRTLLDSVVAGRLDERVRDRIVAETDGNPLALLELPRGLTAAEMAGGFARPDARPLSSQIEEGFLRRVQSLPAETQLLLLTAAAEPVGDVTLLWRAAERLGIALDAAASYAETSGLVTLGTRVRFRHPLVRSAAYRAAGPDDRRKVHQALADATDGQLDPDRRAWHLARAAAGPDETVATELERSAELSPLDELATAKLTLLRGQITFLTRGARAGLPLLLEAANRLEPLDARLARATLRDAIFAALTAGRVPSEVAEAVLAAPKPAEPTHEHLLLEGMARITALGYAAGAPKVLQALTGFRTGGISRDEELGWLLLACGVAQDTWDYESWSVLSARLVEACVAAKRGCENPDELGHTIPSMVELVEASARLGRPADAAEAVQRISDMAQATRTDWALGNAAFTRALVSEGQAADDLYREAIERLGDTEVRMELARVRLCYGEWLRRENRRVDARAQLGVAHEVLSQIGAAAFAERARRELRATGATVRKRTVATYDALTPQETQIARLAADGLTNPEIGARLFISPHTVEWHLRKVFSKLGIASRRQIGTMLSQGAVTSA